MLGKGREWLASRRKLKHALEADFQNALASDSLLGLGRYLDHAIGQFSLTEYAKNAEVKRRVDTFLARVEEYIGASDEMPTVNVPVASTVTRVEVDDEFRTVELRLSEGAVWDALAALRRIIERRLVLYAADHQIALPSRPGAGRIVEMLRRNNAINDDIATNLRASIDIANRGVHGLDVSTEQAYYALRLAQDSLSGLKVG